MLIVLSNRTDVTFQEAPSKQLFLCRIKVLIHENSSMMKVSRCHKDPKEGHQSIDDICTTL